MPGLESGEFIMTRSAGYVLAASGGIRLQVSRLARPDLARVDLVSPARAAIPSR